MWSVKLLVASLIVTACAMSSQLGLTNEESRQQRGNKVVAAIVLVTGYKALGETIASNCNLAIAPQVGNSKATKCSWGLIGRQASKHPAPQLWDSPAPPHGRDPSCYTCE